MSKTNKFSVLFLEGLTTALIITFLLRIRYVLSHYKNVIIFFQIKKFNKKKSNLGDFRMKIILALKHYEF